MLFILVCALTQDEYGPFAKAGKIDKKNIVSNKRNRNSIDYVTLNLEVYSYYFIVLL